MSTFAGFTFGRVSVAPLPEGMSFFNIKPCPFPKRRFTITRIDGHKVKRSDVTTAMVLEAIRDHEFDAYCYLTNYCGFPARVVLAAFQREDRRGMTDYGVSEARPWLEYDGREWLAAHEQEEA